VKFRCGAPHILLPVDQRAEWTFFSIGDDEDMQRVWAREHGLALNTALGDILKAQIEHHRADVFYNLDTAGWGYDLIKGLPGCVKAIIGWHASPLGGVSFRGYDMVVCNFPSIRASISALGCRTEHFFPAYDPEFTPFAARNDRPIDVLFVGGYSRHHRARAAILETVASLASEFNVAFHLDRSRLCRLAESPLGQLLPLAKHRRPAAIRVISREPKFGRDYYDLLSAAKIVLNGSIDMAGPDRGNQRCFEAFGSASLLLSDEGNYMEGMRDGDTLVTYNSSEQAVQQIRNMMEAPDKRMNIARAGHEMVSTLYSKEIQWQRFEALAASI
jgi:Glycosyl transferases group 1